MNDERSAEEAASLPAEMNVLNSTRERSRQLGTAVGVGGAVGATAWFNRHNVENAVDAVRPATGRGFAFGVLWLAGFVTVVVLGRLLVPSLAEWWGVIALVVTTGVAGVWKRIPHRSRS